jgi:hypothetical protein
MVITACVISVLVCVALAITAGGPVRLVLPLLILVQVTSSGDVGALTVVPSKQPMRGGGVPHSRSMPLPAM